MYMAKDFDKDFHKRFGDRIRQLRESKKLTQEQLSLMIGADNSYMAIVENAHRDLPLSKIHKIANALKVEPKEFFVF